MKFNDKKRIFFSIIKVISILLIASAIGLESANAYALLTNSNRPSGLELVFGIERFAIVVHFVEGVIAAYKAPSRKKKSIEYGTYTFFVGTVGLLELFEK